MGFLGKIYRSFPGWASLRRIVSSGLSGTVFILGCLTVPVTRISTSVLEIARRISSANSLIGASLPGGAVKNVIALANGIAVGMGLGENSQSSLITRGLAEIGRLGVALGADPLTFQGLAGVGDLVATCQSPLSRNRTFGENLGKGLTISETINMTNQTCEAFKSCQPILELAQGLGIEMPITAEVVEVLHRGKPPRELLSAFMARDTRSEI